MFRECQTRLVPKHTHKTKSNCYTLKTISYPRCYMSNRNILTLFAQFCKTHCLNCVQWCADRDKLHVTSPSPIFSMWKIKAPGANIKYKRQEPSCMKWKKMHIYIFRNLHWGRRYNLNDFNMVVFLSCSWPENKTDFVPGVTLWDDLLY